MVMPDSNSRIVDEISAALSREFGDLKQEISGGLGALNDRVERLQAKLCEDIQSLSSQISEIKTELKRVEGDVQVAQRVGNDAKEEIAKIEKELRELEKRADEIRRDQDVLKAQSRIDIPERMAVMEELVRGQKWVNRVLVSGIIGVIVKVFFDLMKTV